MTEWRGHNDTSVNLTVTINGTDYSANQGPGFVESTFIDSDNPQGKYWSGQLTLTNDIARVVSGSLVASIDLDPVTNTDLDRGNLVVIVANGNTWNFRVEAVNITRWTAAIVPSEIEIELTDKLGLVNREFPANAPFRTSVTRIRNRAGSSITTLSTSYSTWIDAITSELTSPTDSDGAAILTSADLDLSGSTVLASGIPDGYSSPQNRGKNPYDNATAIASVRGYTLYCDPTDEKIRLTQYPLDSSEGVLAWRWSLDQMLAFDPSLTPLDEPVEAVSVSTRSVQVRRPANEGGDEEDMQNWPITIPLVVITDEDGDNPVVVCERIEQEPSISGSRWTQDYSVRAQLGWIFPANGVNTAFATVCQGAITRVQNEDGNPLVNDDVNSVSRGVKMENGSPVSRLPVVSEYYGDTTLVPGQGTRERFTYDTRGVAIERIKRTRGTLVSFSLTDTPGAVQTDVTAVRVLASETERNTYRPDGKYNQTIAYSVAAMAITSNNDDTGLTADPNQKPVTRVIEGVPRADSARTPTEPVGVEQNDKEEKVDSPLGRGRKASVIRSWGTSSQHASAAAKMAIALKQQGSLSFDAERVVQPGESMVPFRVEHVGDRALVRDAERISWEPNEMKYTYTGRQLGVLAEAVESPVRVVVIPTATLTAGPMGDLV